MLGWLRQLFQKHEYVQVPDKTWTEETPFATRQITASRRICVYTGTMVMGEPTLGTWLLKAGVA